MRPIFYFVAFSMLLFCANGVPLLAQNAEKLLQEANYYYNNFEFEKAIAAYRDVLLQDNSLEAKIKLADSYRQINQWDKAEYWYKLILPLTAGDPTQKLRYAQTLQGMQRYGEARALLLEYSKFDPWGTQLAEGCAMAEQLMQPNDKYIVESLNLNMSGHDFGVSFYEKGIVFCSDRKSNVSKANIANLLINGTNSADVDMYYTERQDSGYVMPEKLKGKVNTSSNDGPFVPQSITTAYYTHSFPKPKNVVAGEKYAQTGIFSTVLMIDGKWSDGTPFQHNQPNYSVAHPTLSPDGQNIYFISDMTGGFGGTDIYVCTKIDSLWSAPINLGPTVNTPGNELFTFMHPDGTLVFASDGHAGLGGLDIYATQRMGSTWRRPRNLGAPFNTNWDDFAFIINNDHSEGYFSSNRPMGFGSTDIYHFALPGLPAPTITTPATMSFGVVELNGNNIINERLGMAPIKFVSGNWLLTSDNFPELDKAADYLKANPDAKIEIAAHTDSRGDDILNQEISQRRAEAVLQYLYQKGIPPDRMAAVGYGESQLLNQCYNDVPCPDYLHTKNSRVDIKITQVGYIKIAQAPAPIPEPVVLIQPPVNNWTTDSLGNPIFIGGDPNLLPNGTTATDTLGNPVPPPIINPLDTLPPLEFKVFLGPFKKIDNNVYYTFKELNTPADMQNTDKGMVILLGPYKTIAEAEQYERYAKERGSPKTEIKAFANGAIYGIPLKKLKKIGVQ